MLLPHTMIYALKNPVVHQQRIEKHTASAAYNDSIVQNYNHNEINFCQDAFNKKDAHIRLSHEVKHG